jgi:hypothetical protein
VEKLPSYYFIGWGPQSWLACDPSTAGMAINLDFVFLWQELDAIFWREAY